MCRVTNKSVEFPNDEIIRQINAVKSRVCGHQREFLLQIYYKSTTHYAV